MRSSRNRIGNAAVASACAVVFSVIIPIACGGAPKTDGSNRVGSSSTGGSGGSAGSGLLGGTASGGVAGSPASGGTGVIITPTGGTDGGIDIPDASCGAEVQEAMLVPVNMFVMFDRSGSMDDEADEDTGATRWELASAALTTFFQDPSAAGLGVALRFFPHDLPAAGCQGTEEGACDAVACSVPLVPPSAAPTSTLPRLLVDPAPVDTHEAALVAAVAESFPTEDPPNGGGTPMYPALDGALRWASAYQSAHPPPSQQTVVVFVTDGDPNGCEDDFDLIAELASNAYDASSVTTYTIGLTGSNEDDLRAVAEAGRGQSFFVDDGPTAPRDLVAALKAIQGAAIDCDFAIPTPTDGGVADPSRVNVEYSSMLGATPTTFTQVPTAADCGVSQSWYYDDAASPSRIYLCPDVCEAVRANPTAKISVAIGCETIVEPPR